MVMRSAAIVIAMIAVAAEARADEGRWGGLYDGRTLQTGGEAFAEGGFPGVGFGVLFGTSENIDLGLRATLTYSGIGATGFGVYTTDNFVAAPGVDPRIVARFAIANGKVASLLFRLEPGVRFARFDPTRWGPEIVAALDFGLHVMRRGTVYLGVEIPLYLDIPNTTPSNPFAVLMPILFGAGFEYHATDLIGFGARVNPGIEIAAGDIAGSPKTGFALLAQGYFILRWGALTL
jgi:hypothetical protein